MTTNSTVICSFSEWALVLDFHFGMSTSFRSGLPIREDEVSMFPCSRVPKMGTPVLFLEGSILEAQDSIPFKFHFLRNWCRHSSFFQCDSMIGNVTFVFIFMFDFLNIVYCRCMSIVSVHLCRFL